MSCAKSELRNKKDKNTSCRLSTRAELGRNNVHRSSLGLLKLNVSNIRKQADFMYCRPALALNASIFNLSPLISASPIELPAYIRL